MRVLDQAGDAALKGKVNNGDTESRSASKRRSSRVMIDIPVTVFGQTSDRKMFHEQTKTITVSAHGALVLLKSNIDSVRPVLMMNPRTQMEVQCRVAFRKDIAGGGAEIALEFSDPLPKYWGIHFPPDDWDPAERKRPASFQGPTSDSTGGPKR